MSRRSKYPTEFRAHAVELWRTSGKSQRAVALELGISNELLRQWVRKAEADEGTGTAGGTGALAVYRHQLRPVLLAGAEAVDRYLDEGA